MKYLFITALAIPIIYLLIAVTLILLPVKRVKPVDSLDFEVLADSYTSSESHIDSEYDTRDGKKLFYRLIDGSKDTVIILLHGSGTEGRYLLSLANNLHDELKATIVVPDLRGHGESSLLLPGDVDYLGQFEDDLEDLRNVLKTTYPDANYFLSGHSSGGGLALKYGGNASAEFSGYILLAPYLGYNAPTVRPDSGGWVQVAGLRYIGLAMLNQVGISWLNYQPVLFFNRPDNIDLSLQVEQYTYRLNESFSPKSYKDSLEKNKSPILVLVGQDDEAFYSEKYEEVFAKHAMESEVRIIQGLKHLDLPSEEGVAELISSWVRKTQQ